MEEENVITSREASPAVEATTDSHKRKLDSLEQTEPPTDFEPKSEPEATSNAEEDDESEAKRPRLESNGTDVAEDEALGAKIKVVRDAEADPRAPTSPLELVGTLADDGGSPSLVARGFSTVQAATGGEQLEIRVPIDKVGLIIGKGRETIRNLQTKSGARIQLIQQSPFDGDQPRERIVRITGNKKQIDFAREMIGDVINQLGEMDRFLQQSSSSSSNMLSAPRTRGACKGKEKGYNLRVASWNVGTLSSRLLEVVDVLKRRKAQIACLQETRWEGNKEEECNGYKLYSGSNGAKKGVGFLVDMELHEKVIEVKRHNDRIMVLRLVLGMKVVAVVCAYAPQVGLEDQEKREFWDCLDVVVRAIPRKERIIIGGDFKGQIGKDSDGFQSVHGGFGFGDMNESGRDLLDFAVAHDLGIINSSFKKRESHLITFSREGHNMQIDYLLMRREDRRLWKDCKVLPGESSVTQHRLLVADITLQTRSRARIQSIRQNPSDGDQSRERIVRNRGNKKQNDFAREMIRDVMSQTVRPSPLSGGYSQQGFRPRGPAPPQWGPRGPQYSGYDYPQRGSYPSQHSQYPPLTYGNYPPPQAPRGNFGPSWDPRLSMHGPLSHQGPEYGHPPPPYSQALAQHYGHGYNEVKYDHHAPAQQYGQMGSQPTPHPQGGTHSGYGPPQDQYGKPPAYGMQPKAPHSQPFTQPRPSQPGEVPPYQGPTQSYGQNVPPPQQFE